LKRLPQGRDTRVSLADRSCTRENAYIFPFDSENSSQDAAGRKTVTVKQRQDRYDSTGRYHGREKFMNTPNFDIMSVRIVQQARSREASNDRNKYGCQLDYGDEFQKTSPVDVTRCTAGMEVESLRKKTSQ
jgi:hypothetical protein